MRSIKLKNTPIYAANTDKTGRLFSQKVNLNNVCRYLP